MSYSFVAFLVLSHLDLVCLADPLSLLVYLHLGACWAHTLSVYSPVVLFILPQMWPHIDNPKSKNNNPNQGNMDCVAGERDDLWYCEDVETQK